MATTTRFMTVGQAAARLGVRDWQIVSLYRRRFLPEPVRLGRFRAIDPDDLPKVREALVRAGYLAGGEAEPGASSGEEGGQET
jgi:predicted DNA-binding transcriptional regulator AlpA